MNGYGVAGVFAGLSVVVSALWFADHWRQESVRADAAYADVAASRDEVVEVLRGQLVLRESLDKIDRQTLAITNALDGQTAQLNRNLVEMKRTDEKARAYLAELIPVALGLRYARPETTDPVAYRAGAVVQPGVVPASGPPAIAQ